MSKIAALLILIFVRVGVAQFTVGSVAVPPFSVVVNDLTNPTIPLTPNSSGLVIPATSTGPGIGCAQNFSTATSGTAIVVDSSGLMICQFDGVAALNDIAGINGQYAHDTGSTSDTISIKNGKLGRIVNASSLCTNCYWVIGIAIAERGSIIPTSYLTYDSAPTGSNWGQAVQSGTVNGSGHLILTLLGGGTLDVGAVIGPAGTTPTLASGTITTLAAGASATASLSGTAPNYSLNLGLPQGVAGTAGSAAAIAVGTTTNLSPGTSATVNNSGTSSAAVFNFGIPSAAAISQSAVTRSLNACFQVSSTRNAEVHYSVEIGTTLSLSGGTQGQVTLSTYSDSACTLNAQELGRFTNGNTGTLTIGLNISQTLDTELSGFVTAGSYVKLFTANTTGTPTFTYRSGQEVLF